MGYLAYRCSLLNLMFSKEKSEIIIMSVITNYTRVHYRIEGPLHESTGPAMERTSYALKKKSKSHMTDTKCEQKRVQAKIVLE